MPRNTTTALLAGHAPSSMHKTPNNGGNGHMQKKNKKPMKSNITNQVKSKRTDSLPVGDVVSDDDDDGDGIAADEATTSDDDADVSALSGAQQHDISGAEQRLAGHGMFDEDMNMMMDVNTHDENQATVGAFDFVFDDDDDYTGVENVSDGDNEEEEDAGEEQSEESILRSAEQDLIAEFETTETRRNANSMTATLDKMDLTLEVAEAAAFRLGLLTAPTDTSDGFDSTINLNDDPFQGHPVLGVEYQELLGTAEIGLWRMPETIRNRESSDPTSTTQKRVRFEERREPTRSPSPSASEDEDASEAFPDIFMPADSQTASHSLAGLMTDDVFAAGDWDDNESFYDFGDEHETLAWEVDEESGSDSDASSYDSDHSGDTTDEETEDVAAAKDVEMRQAALEAMEKIRKGTEQEKKANPATPKRPMRTRSSATPRPGTPKTGPKKGFFEIDPTKAAVTPDTEGGKNKMHIQPPSKPLEKDKAYWEAAKSAANSRDGSPRGSFHIVRSASSDSMPARPFTAKSTLGSMFNGNLDILRNNDTNGIAEDLFPHVMSRPQSSYSSFDGTEETDTDQHVDMAMQDLVNIDDSDSDAEMGTNAITSPTTPGAFPSLARDSSDLFDHFTQNRAVVGAFRQNQNLAKQLSSQASHPAQRASTHEYNALQKGRRGAANTPITPARKKRHSQEFSAHGRSLSGVKKAMQSPLVNRRPRSRGNSLANANLYQTIGRNPFD